MVQLRCYSPKEDSAPGGLLQELEARQDEVLAQLDELNAKVEAVLIGLGVRLDEPYEPTLLQTADDEQ